MHRSSKQKISEETMALNDTMDQMDLPAIFRTFHPKRMEYTFFSSAHETFSRIEHMLGHKTSFNKSIISKRLKSYHASFLTTTL